MHRAQRRVAQGIWLVSGWVISVGGGAISATTGMVQHLGTVGVTTEQSERQRVGATLSLRDPTVLTIDKTGSQSMPSILVIDNAVLVAQSDMGLKVSTRANGLEADVQSGARETASPTVYWHLALYVDGVRTSAGGVDAAGRPYFAVRSGVSKVEIRVIDPPRLLLAPGQHGTVTAGLEVVGYADSLIAL